MATIIWAGTHPNRETLQLPTKTIQNHVKLLNWMANKKWETPKQTPETQRPQTRLQPTPPHPGVAFLYPLLIDSHLQAHALARQLRLWADDLSKEKSSNWRQIL